MKKNLWPGTVRNAKSAVNAVNKTAKKQAETGFAVFTATQQGSQMFTAAPYKAARDIYFTMEVGAVLIVADTKIRYALHTLHNREKRNVIFKTKIVIGGLKIWRVL